jgi:hypothetical protein
VREWRRYWLVRVQRAVPGGWPKTEVREQIAETPAELRAMVDEARADPRMLAYRYESRRDLVGDDPTHCGRGHRYGSSYRDIRRDWLVCGCGGHMAYVCLIDADGAACGDVQIDPPLLYDCDARWPRI